MNYENFVQVQLAAPLGSSDTTLTLANPTGAYRLPPATGGILVLADSVGSPLYTEIIRYESRSNNVLNGLTRGLEGTTARAWVAGSYCYQSLTAGEFGKLTKVTSTYKFVATAGQQTFTGVDANGATLNVSPNACMVFLNGSYLEPLTDYSVPAANQILLTSQAGAGDELIVLAFGAFQVADSYSAAQVESRLAAAEAKFGEPVLDVRWVASRDLIGNGRAASDGQLLSRATYPDAWAAIAAGKVPVVSDAVWLADPTKRGCYSTGDGSTTFRLPDYNGKSAGSLGAVFQRGDGALSAGQAGLIQESQNKAHTHTSSVTASTAGAGSYLNAYNRSLTTDHSFNTLQTILDPSGGAEARPLNVTGCWVIKLFGAVVNVGSADAAQLASDLANLANQVDFTIIYPNGGSAASPANITVNSRYIEANPFPGYRVFCALEIYTNGVWRKVEVTGFASQAFGGFAGQHNDGSVEVCTAATALLAANLSHGHYTGTATGGNVTLAAARVLVWKVKGAIA